MSNNDKAKEKLMESMRMTKAGSDKTVVEADSQQDLMPQDDKLVKNEKKAAAKKKAAKVTQKATVDSFQSVRRVWPD